MHQEPSAAVATVDRQLVRGHVFSGGLSGVRIALVPVTEPRPFLKWAGGKRQLLPQFRRFYPDDFGTYHEPFLGSGAVFFDLWQLGKLRNRRAILTDDNADLIGCYLRVRDKTSEVVTALERLAHGHERHEREHYYRVRNDRSTRAGAHGARAGASRRHTHPNLPRC